MKFPVSTIDDITRRLRHVSERATNVRSAVHLVSSKSAIYDKIILCKAVEDRICRKIDLASRDDLTLHQAVDALRLLLKIVQQNRLSVDFSSAEKLLLACIDHLPRPMIDAG
jgi:hypothetical protein